MFEAYFNKSLKACNFIKKRLQHRCFLAKFASRKGSDFRYLEPNKPARKISFFRYSDTINLESERLSFTLNLRAEKTFTLKELLFGMII